VTAARLLDRYVLTSWLRLFAVTALGFPFVAIMIDMTERLTKLLDQGLTLRQIVVSYVYAFPEYMALVMPAAVLFATVFTVGAMARHSELTAAKAGGVSFHRLVAPLFIVAAIAAVLAVAVGELSVGTTAQRKVLQKERVARATASKFNFVYRADQGWVYAIRSLDVTNRTLRQLLLEREGTGADYPSIVVTADSATWDADARDWRLWNGESRFIGDAARQYTFAFHTLRLGAMTQTPVDLLAESKAPEEMRYGELGRYIESLQRAGNESGALEVAHALKIAVPAACLVIALFGAPLAVASPRSGTAFGIAVSLGTTIVYLMLTQIAKAVGAGGVVHPLVAAWLPNAVFLLAGLVLLDRVRT
jgi:lipopolysaccharide export system permease protein